MSFHNMTGLPLWALPFGLAILRYSRSLQRCVTLRNFSNVTGNRRAVSSVFGPWQRSIHRIAEFSYTHPPNNLGPAKPANHTGNFQHRR